MVDPTDFDPPYNSYAVEPSTGAEAGGATSKLGFIGSVGIGGGQGNADCIYGVTMKNTTA